MRGVQKLALTEQSRTMVPLSGQTSCRGYE